MDFPQEVLESIFINLDGKSLGRASQVNSIWKFEVKRISQKGRIWEKICKKEIPRNALDDISKKHFLFEVCPSKMHLEWAEWRSIYVSWCQWPRISRYPKTTRELCKMTTTAEMITCAKLSGNCVVTGHALGHVMVWCRYSGLLAHAKPNDSRVTDMLLMDVNGVARRAKANELGEMSHDFVITSATDGLFSMTMLARGTEQVNGPTLLDPGPFIERIHNKQIIEIRSLDGNMFSVISSEDIMSMWKVTPAPDAQDQQPILQCIERCWLPFLENKPQIFRKLHLGRTLASKNIKSTMHHVPTCTCYRCIIIVEAPNQSIQDPKYFKHNIGIWMTYQPEPKLHVAMMVKHIVTKKHYNVWPQLYSWPSCFLLHGPALFVGLESGILLMFVVRQIIDLFRLRLDEPDWRHVVAADRIIALDVNNGAYGLGVMATTRSQVFYIAFYPPGD